MERLHVAFRLQVETELRFSVHMHMVCLEVSLLLFIIREQMSTAEILMVVLD